MVHPARSRFSPVAPALRGRSPGSRIWPGLSLGPTRFPHLPGASAPVATEDCALRSRSRGRRRLATSISDRSHPASLLASASRSLGGRTIASESKRQGYPHCQPEKSSLTRCASACPTLRQRTVPSARRPWDEKGTRCGQPGAGGQIRGCPRNCKRRARSHHATAPSAREGWSDAETREPGDLPSAVTCPSVRGVRRGRSSACGDVRH